MVSAEELTKAYNKLYPEEFDTENSFDEIKRILDNWLEEYKSSPEKKIGVCNWYGKVSKSLFVALNIKQPKTKTKMLEILNAE